MSLLPELWQGVSKLNPIIYMVNTFRYGFLGVSDIDVGYAFAIVALFVAILFGIALTLINKGVGLRS